MDFENKWKKMYPPISHLPDTNYWHYSLQLNIYRRILQELYGEVVSELALVVLHPNFEHYRVIKLNMMDEEVEAMFQVRAARLAALAEGPETPLAAASTTVEEEPEPEATGGKPLFVEED